LEALKETAKHFTGEIEQVPPAYSAIKVNGQRAYKLARAGKAVIIEPRKVMISKLEIVNYDYPEVQLIADVSSGTYIRTLVEDLGKMLGAGAFTSDLRRTRVGHFEVSDACSTDELTATMIAKLYLIT
jgi:tRNA pseudouridine55 synthase